ncbi:MAG: OFA family MFS transporter [Deltaproteobacteria bacterium]|nr:OFA family MFS transporter [Deltaproteobacteria bacterium]
MKGRTAGWVVTAAGTGVNLALGVLYSWSIFKAAIRQSIEAGGAGAFQWDLTSVNDPYAVCCLVFAFGMIVAGRCQDVFGPRVTTMLGGVLVGAGFLWVSGTTTYGGWVFGFGVLAGTGIAFGYASATPPAMRWFAPNESGKIAGIVVAGFGLASVYIAPLSQYLVSRVGLSTAMKLFGLGFFAVVSALALLLRNPPPEHQVAGVTDSRRRGGLNALVRQRWVEPDLTPGRFLSTGTFWLLWLLYFVGAGAGLMVIGSIAGLAKKSLGANAFAAVALMAVGNAGGRLVAGVVSDRLGRVKTLGIVFVLQALLMVAAVPVTGSAGSGAVLVVLVATFIGFNYGANLALFPTMAKECAGVKNFGVNYGLLFTAWGVGGFVMSKVAERLSASGGSFRASFLLAASLLVAGAVLSLFVTDHKAEQFRRIRADLIREGLAET